MDDAREIIEAVRYKPMQARTKVFILDEVHMLTNQAFNALLKTLESRRRTSPSSSPPPKSARCRSRCCRAASASTCAAFPRRNWPGCSPASAAAESVAIAPGAIELIARAADGSARDGLSLLDQAIARMDGAEVTAPEVADMLAWPTARWCST